jgi:hypothetical protein
MACFGGFATIGVPTFGVDLLQSLDMAFRGFYWFHLCFGVGVATLCLFCNFVTNVIPRIINAKFCIFLRRWFASIVFYGIP